MYYVTVITALAALLPFKVLAQEPTSVEILSKDDTQAMFAMTEDQWLANVQQAVASGIARSMGTPEVGIMMAVSTAEDDILMVRPSYGENKQKPEFVQVVVGFRYPRSELLTKEKLKEAIHVAKEQMKPEFMVIGHVEEIADGISIDFIIDEKE